MVSSSPTPEDVGTRLRTAREQKGLSQSELAAKTGLQPSAISHFETGRRAPSFENLRVLADALSVSTDSLIGRERPAVAGPAAEQMFRDFAKLSSSDQEKLAEFAKLLAAKKKREDKG